MNLVQYSDSLLSVVPALLAVILAIATRRVLLSLGLGIVAGAILLNDYNPLAALKYIVHQVVGLIWSDGAVNSGNVNMIIFMLLLGGLISLMTATGATRAFAEWGYRRCKDRRSANMLTSLMVFAFFIDDFFHSLSVGPICRPVTDRFNISRAKLAYLLDSTAAPVCVITPISSWGAYIIAILGGILATNHITDISAISLFVQMIPMNLYAVFTLLMVIVVIFFQLNIGPMRQHEAWAEEGKLWDESKGHPKGLEITTESSGKGTMIDMVLPILTLTVSSVIFMVISGADVLASRGEAFSLIKSLEHTDLGSSLVNASLCSLAVSMVLALRLKLSLKTWLTAAPQGIQAMMPAIVILMFAWTIGTVVSDMKTGLYLASLTKGGFPTELLPALVFVLSCAMSFATGTSWGTFGIMLPLAGDMAVASDAHLLMPMLSAVLAGSVFGDHSSPISSTSILSATGAGSHHMDHVMTQLPYAVTVAFGALLGYLTMGIMSSTIAGIGVSALWFLACCTIHLRRHRKYQQAVTA
ncbi:Na+/H+ antiporter NhaC family protein [Photobacterium leiognathi]|uniref:Na+/H+ antiporter NhaC family protein n=1 Tax=Photobacterium leiognathi TaxID=553611 RepID=UPI00273645C8|nr:Na+/H+ antiporter NhaC family protein [Photobacterium leiognathi]